MIINQHPANEEEGEVIITPDHGGGGGSTSWRLKRWQRRRAAAAVAAEYEGVHRGGVAVEFFFACGAGRGGKSKFLVRPSELCAKNFVIPFDYHNHSGK